MCEFRLQACPYCGAAVDIGTTFVGSLHHVADYSGNLTLICRVCGARGTGNIRVGWEPGTIRKPRQAAVPYEEYPDV